MGIALYITIIIGIICFTAYIFSRVFKLKQQRWIQQKQLDILAALAYKAGMTEEELTEIMEREVP